VTLSVAADVSVGEWTTTHLPGIHLTHADRGLAKLLHELGRLAIYDLQEGLRIESRGWIGVVRLEGCTIRIEPNLIDGHRNLVRLLDYLQWIDLMKRLPSAASFEAEGGDLFDLIAWLMASACEDVLRAGVNADYMPQHDELTVLRGRVDLKAQALRLWGRVDRLQCDFEDRVRDIPENRWLRRGLRVARGRVRNAGVAFLVRRMCTTWDELCQDDPTESLERVPLTRINAHYRQALELAYLIVGGVTVSDVFHHGSVGGFSFLLNMPRLFEEFVSRAVENCVPTRHLRVIRQASERSVLWDAEEHRSYGRVRPDLLLESDDGVARLPIDAKYKNYDVHKLDPGDVYQAAIYALTLARGASRSKCVVIYPAARARRQQRVQVRVASEVLADIVAVGVSVPVLLDELLMNDPGTEMRALMDTIGW